MTLGEHLHRQRVLAGVRMVDVAAAVDVHRTTVYRWEQDALRPSPEQMATLADLYEMDVRARTRAADLYLWGEVS